MKKSLLCLLFIFGSLGFVKSQTVVTFYTTEGNFKVELYDVLKPITAGNFLSLVEQGFYDDVIFHRVISNFVIQGGDPTGTGYGGPGYTIEDEFDENLSNTIRTLSMANSGPNTGGSQFFINLTNNSHLDFDNEPYSSAHPVFGEVIGGWNIVQIIEDVPVDGGYRPTTPVVMDSIRVTVPFLSVSSFSNNKYSFSIQPNPISILSEIEINSKIDDTVEFFILNVNGVLIAKKTFQLNEGINKIKLSNFGVDNFSNGMYFMMLNCNNNISHKRFLIGG